MRAKRLSEEATIAVGTCATVIELADSPGPAPEAPPEGGGTPLAPVTVPPGEAWIEGENVQGARIGRFAETATRPLGLTPGQDMALTLPEAAAADVPWKLQLYGDGPVTVCAA